MIISHEHRFIFIKTQKTAGTSIEVMLSDLVEEGAVVTPVNPPVAGHRARNFARTGRSVIDVPASVRGGLRRVRRAVTNVPDRPQTAFYNHIPATRVLELVGSKMWDSYRTVTVERNPWDKVASAYFWHRDGETNPEDFRAWVASRAPATTQVYTVAGSLPVDFPRYTLDGRTVGVDTVIRYEHLEEDLASTLAQVGLASTVLPRSKGGVRPATSLDDLYDEETIDLVAQAFAAEISTFGYSFPA